MKKKLLTFASLGLGVVAVALAQPPQQEGGPGRSPLGPGGEHGPPPLPLVEVLDADRDHQLSAEEIANAAEALKKLDHDGDGKLSHEEFLPPPPPRPEMGDEGRPAPPLPPGAGGRRGPGPRGPGGPEFRGPREGRPGGGPDDRMGPPPEGRRGGGQAAGPGRGAPPRDAGPSGDAGPPREAGRGPRGPGRPGPGAGPDPARFVEHVFEFDANGDGMISRDELQKFAQQMPGPGGPDR